MGNLTGFLLVLAILAYVEIVVATKPARRRGDTNAKR